MEVSVHVNSVAPVLFVIPTTGGVLFWVIVMLEVEVQPPDPVTVTVYVPGLVKLLLAVPVVAPPLHK